MDGIVEHPLLTSDEMAAEAWAAMSKQDTDAALRLWQRLRQHFPERPEGHICPVQVLWQAGRIDEAEAVAEEAFARFPDDPEMFVQYAWIAMLRQRWDEALDWWAKARARLPERPDTYVWAARALWQAGRLDEAKTMAEDGVGRFPDSIDAQAECAWVAIARHDWEEALRYWKTVVQRAPERPDGHVGAIQATRMLGRPQEAEAMVQAALVRFPDNANLMVEHIWTAAAREDWPEAASRLKAARGKLHDAGRLEDSLGWVEYRLRSELGSDASAAAPMNAEAAVASGEDEISTADLMLSFESLGERCDFGAVQRKFGVEPLGLLRFAYSKYDALVAGLEDRLEAVGSVEDTGFELYNDENILIMKKYGLVFHTFVDQNELGTQEKRDRFRQQQRRRLGFLRDKLIADLEEPQKIYIYSSEERVSDADATRLFRALRAYGPNSLLYLRPATKTRTEGMVEALSDGLYVGYFDALADFVSGNQPTFELWRQLCERTYRLSRAAS
ncbi:MAG TPA: tetratricopeptide repeat protein [Stellaceae bacterium]|nr:tetratricopeptide repeat protein [Stellaceae bacterium]